MDRTQPVDAHPAFPERVVERVIALLGAPSNADAVLARWHQRFAAVADTKLRRVVLQACLTEADDGTLLGSLARLEARADQGDSAMRWMLTELALTPSLLLDLPYARIVELYAAAQAAGLPELSRRFYGDRPTAPSAIANPHLEASAGERTAYARRPDRHLLDRLTHDRDPRVITALLDNPRLIERDVVRIAALRPTNPEVLPVIACHPRWSQRSSVKKALAFNPCTPSSLARQLLPTLLRQDLVELSRSNLLAPDLREAAAARLHPQR